MPSFALTKFQELANATSGERAASLLSANPVLLAESSWPELMDWVQHCPPETVVGAKRALNTVLSIARDAIADRSIYPLGSGPLEPIVRRLLNGEITEDYARELGSRPEVCGNLSPLYVAVVSMSLRMQADREDWRTGLAGQKVLLAALDARRLIGAAEQDVMEMIAAIDYAQIAARSIWEFADGRLFRDAVRRAEAVRNVEPRPWRKPGEVEFSLGVLHLDPYIYQRTTLNFDQQVQAWMGRTLDKLAAELSEEERKTILMPEPRTSFQTSSLNFHASAEKRTGSDRGLSLKGYIEAEVWTQVAGGRAASNLDEVAREARSLLADERYAGVRAQIDSLINFLKPDAATVTEKSGEDWIATANTLLNTDTAELVNRQGVTQTTEFLLRIAALVIDRSPQSALALWRKAFPLVLQRDETTRKGFYALGLRHIRGALAHPELDKFLSESPVKAATQCQGQAAAQHWPSQQLAATLLSIAVNSQQGNRESEGIKVLVSAAEVDAPFTRELLPLLQWLSGVLQRGLASNEFYAKRYGEAIRAYALAARQFLYAELPQEAEYMLLKGSDIVARSEDQVAEFAAYFSLVLPELQRQGGTTVVRRMHDLCRKWIPLIAKGGQINGFLLMLLLDGVKGSAFASELRGGGSFAWIDSNESRALLDRIEQSRKKAGDEAEANDASGVGTLTNDELLTMYADEEETQRGDSPAVVLHNLEVRYDAGLRRQLAERKSEAERWVPVPEKIQSVLGPETALVTYYSGVAPNGNAGLYVTVFTSDDTMATIIDFGMPAMQLTMNGIWANFLALGVADVRKQINDDPEDRDGLVSAAARKALETCRYIEGPTQILRTLHKKGKWHLCIQPHGPLHFFPFHLLLEDTELLAENWTVTYLPNLALLDPALRQASVRATPIASFGIEFKNGVPHGLPELPGAEEEAQIVASAYNTNSLTGSAATEQAVTNALANARRVHIATHGLHKVSAPSFQRVYLWPDSSSDGILFAYELLRHDLRGLDLITLSACETSLGRIDIGDNLRGMSASALIAGAATVIGTLWPVENTAAITFFGSLHTELAKGANKRESFRMAQTVTRSKHPQYRDWGAFCYSGRW